jgi:hypothetical protein
MPQMSPDGVATAPLLIHVGLHKTGTTWLQKRVFQAKAEREIEYCGDIGLIYRQFIVPSFADFDPEQARARFAPLRAAATEKGRLAVISGENLAGRPFHGKFQREIVADRLAAVLPDAHILITIREQNAVILSMYGQYLRYGYTSSLRAFLKEPPTDVAHDPVLNRSFYDYERLIATYERRFPANKILVVPFEWMLAEPAAMMERLSQGTGIALTPVAAETARQTTNSAWSDLAYDALRHMNRLESQDSRWQLAPGMFRPNAMAARIDRLTPAFLRRRMHKARRQLVEDAIGNLYAASNHRVSQRIGIDLAQYGYRTG